MESTHIAQASFAGRWLARRALFFAALLGGSAMPTHGALAANTPLFFGAKVPSSTLGPVLTGAHIVPIFYGNWGNGLDGDTRNYLNGFAAWLGGAGTPSSFESENQGVEPVLRQYGVWGATVEYGYYFPISNTSPSETQIANSLHQWQSQNLIPPDGANTVFLVLMNGFSGYPWQGPTTCGKHSVSGGTYYALVSFDGCNGGSTPSFQRIVSHELEEAITDPGMWNLSYGWVTHEGSGGVVSNEGADQCETSPDPPHPYNNALWFGTVQNFTDNTPNTIFTTTPNDGSRSGAICNIWVPERTPKFGVTKRSGYTQLDVVYQDFSRGGALMHADFLPNYTWAFEWIDSNPGVINGAPALVTASAGQLDVFARVPDGAPLADLGPGLVHWRKETGQGFSLPNYLYDSVGNSGIGPPTAVSSDPTRIDVFTADTNAGIEHFWSNTTTYSAEHFNLFTMTPPVAVSRGSNMLDVFTYAKDGSLQTLSWNTQSDQNVWSVKNLNVTDIFFSYPADLISAAAWGGPNWVAKSTVQVYASGLLLQFGATTSNWTRTVKTSFGSQENKGTASVASYGDGSEVIAVWFTDGTVDQTNPPGYRVSRWYKGTTSTVQKIGGIYQSPPVAIYGSDGYPEVLGVGQDGCLWETWLDYYSGGPIVNGPNGTGICGLR